MIIMLSIAFKCEIEIKVLSPGLIEIDQQSSVTSIGCLIRSESPISMIVITMKSTCINRFCVAEVGNYNYGPGHPMKPHRIRMTHNLLVNYGVYKELQVFVSLPH